MQNEEKNVNYFHVSTVNNYVNNCKWLASEKKPLLAKILYDADSELFASVNEILLDDKSDYTIDDFNKWSKEMIDGFNDKIKCHCGESVDAEYHHAGYKDYVSECKESALNAGIELLQKMQELVNSIDDAEVKLILAEAIHIGFEQDNFEALNDACNVKF